MIKRPTVTEYVTTYHVMPELLADVIAELQKYYNNIPEEYRTSAYLELDECDYSIYYERPKTDAELEEDARRDANTRQMRINSALRVLKDLNYDGDLNGN